MIQTEEEARKWLAQHPDVSRETFDRLAALVHMVLSENERQNLISASTAARIWSRHIVDSAQLVQHVPSADASWLDLGTGAGFPGLVASIMHRGPVTLVESRKLRVEFLSRTINELGLSAQVLGARIEQLADEKFDVISARAFASAERTFGLAHRFSTEKTRWILPKGRSASTELEAARSTWQGQFRLALSITDPDAGIIIADGVQPSTPARRRR